MVTAPNVCLTGKDEYSRGDVKQSLNVPPIKKEYISSLTDTCFVFLHLLKRFCNGSF